MMPCRHSNAPDLRGLPECASDLHDSVAIVLRGISLDAWNNARDLRTAVEAHRLAWQYAYDPDLRKRLSEDESALDSVQMQMATAKQASRSKVIGWLAIVGFFVVAGIIGSFNSTNNSSNSNSYMPPSAPSAPSFTPPASSTSAYSPTVNGNDVNSGGNVYSVPDSISSTLDKEKAEIETERIALQSLDGQVEQLGREIENDRLTLDTTSQYAVDTFNTKVDRYNALVQKDKETTAAFNQRVDNYNEQLRSYSKQ